RCSVYSPRPRDDLRSVLGQQTNADGHWHPHQCRERSHENYCDDDPRRVRESYETVEDRRQSKNVKRDDRDQNRKQLYRRASQLRLGYSSGERTAKRAEREHREQHHRERINRMAEKQNELLDHRDLDHDKARSKTPEIQKERKF